MFFLILQDIWQKENWLVAGSFIAVLHIVVCFSSVNFV